MPKMCVEPNVLCILPDIPNTYTRVASFCKKWNLQGNRVASKGYIFPHG